MPSVVLENLCVLGVFAVTLFSVSFLCVLLRSYSIIKVSEGRLNIPLVPPSKGETCCFNLSQLFSLYAMPFFFAFLASLRFPYLRGRDFLRLRSAQASLLPQKTRDPFRMTTEDIFPVPRCPFLRPRLSPDCCLLIPYFLCDLRALCGDQKCYGLTWK